MNFLRSAFVVSSGTLLSRIFGFIRDIFFAKYLGTGFLSDVFLTAFRLPNFFRNIFAEGAFQRAFVPLFAGTIEKKNDEETHTFANNILSILLYFLLILTIVIEIFMPTVIKIIAPGFINNPSKFALAITLSKITFPYLIFISLVSFLSGILNSLNKFAAVSLAPIILNICLILGSIASSIAHINVAITLSYAVLIGGILQLFWLMFFTLKEGIILFPRIPVWRTKTKEFARNFFTSFIGSGVTQLNSMIDSVMATTIAGAVSYIYYGDRISQLPLALIGTALSTTILPVLSKKIVSEDANEINKIQELSIFISLFIGIPAGVGLFMLSDLIIPMLFERGAFVHGDSVAVASVLKVYAISLPITILIKILQTIYYAHKDTKTPMYISIFSLISNVILNFILMKFMSFMGIILSTVITSFVNLFFLFIILYKRNKLIISKDLLNKIAKILYSSIIMGITILACNLCLKDSGTLLSRIEKFTATSILAVLVYFFISYVVGAINSKFINEILVKDNQ